MTTMNYLISQIQNFEQCNAGVPVSLLREAAADVIQDAWCDYDALTTAIKDGSIDHAEQVEIVNSALESAGCEHRVDESDVKTALATWMETETMFD